ncbi:MAG: MATE family efflux transporter [Bacteroidota bacterium]
MTGTSYKQIWHITYPIILGSVAQNIVYVVDTAFLGRVSEVALGAAAIAGLFYVAIFMLGMGFGTGAQIIIARKNGENDYAGIGKVVDHSFYFLFVFAFVLFLLIKFASPVFLEQIVSSNDVYNATAEYLDYRAWGIFFALINVTFRAFYIGIASTKVLIWSTAVMATVNVLLDYCLIFGNWGFPEMGIGGAAIASVVSEASIWS